MMENLLVRSTRTDGRIALWERHPAHPGGEVCIGDTNPIRVGRTPRVLRALASGRLAVVPAPDPPAKPARKASGSKSDRKAKSDPDGDSEPDALSGDSTGA